MRHKRAISAMFVFFLLISAAVTFAQEAQPPIRVGWFQRAGDSEVINGKYVGYDFDYLAEAAKYTDWKFEFIETKYPECYAMLDDGRLDILCDQLDSEELAKKYAFAGVEYKHSYTKLFTSHNTRLVPYDFEHFDGMTVGVLSGEQSNEHLKEYANEMGFTYAARSFSSTAEVLQAVADGVVDTGLLCDLPPTNQMCVLAEFWPRSRYFVTARENNKLLVELNRALNMIRVNEPQLESELYGKHFAAPKTLQLTDSELALVHASKASPITVGVIDNNAPMCEWSQKEGRFIGIFIELLQAISDKTGLQFKFVKLDLAKNPPITLLKQKSAQVVAGILKTQKFEDDASIRLSSSVINNSLVVIGKRGQDFRLDPEQTTFAIMSGFQVAQEYIAEHFPKHKVIIRNTLKDCLDEIMCGRADVTVFLESGAAYMLQDPHYEGLEIKPTFAKEVEQCTAALHPQNKQIISIIDKGIAMLSDEERNNVVMNYTIMHSYQPTIYDLIYKYKMPITIIFILFFIVMAILFVLIIYKRRNAQQLSLVYEQEKSALALAEKASAAKGSFMSRMSHEIRTPLNALIGYNTIASSEMALAADKPERGESDRKVRDCLHKSGIASKHLLTIINDILDMSAIESGKITVAHERFNFMDMTASLNAIFASQAVEKGVIFDVVLETAINEWFIGDQLRLNQVLTNLLSNAVKFTPAKGRVTLAISQQSCGANSASLRFVVRDNGIGIDEQHIKRIWTPFDQGDASISRRFGGTGLGLAITKNLVDLMGGTISVESACDSGATFTVDIELEFATPPKNPTEREENRKNAIYDFSGARVLLVEDNAMNIEIARHILCGAGLKVDTAKNGREAVELFETSPVGTYKAILMDIQMPEMDGHQATRAIRASSHPEASTMPIIAMTADAFAENVSEAINSGMNEHIAKPIDTHVLFATLRKYIC